MPYPASRQQGRHRAREAQITPLLEKTGLAAVGAAALEHGRLDARHFRALIEAMQFPHGYACETAARAAAIDEAAAAVRSNTERLLAICGDAIAQLEAVARYADPSWPPTLPPLAR